MKKLPFLPVAATALALILPTAAAASPITLFVHAGLNDTLLVSTVSDWHPVYIPPVEPAPIAPQPTPVVDPVEVIAAVLDSEPITVTEPVGSGSDDQRENLNEELSGYLPGDGPNVVDTGDIGITVIPEPGSLALLATGMVATCFTRLRRRRTV